MKTRLHTGEVFVETRPETGERRRIEVIRPMTFDQLEHDDARIRVIGTLSALRHPQLPRVIGAGIRDGCLMLTTDDFEGDTLRALTTRGTWPPSSQIWAWLEMVAIAMADAKAEGIYHPTIGLDSIVVTKRGEVKVHGFGVEQLRAGELLTPDDRDAWRRSAASFERIQLELMERR